MDQMAVAGRTEPSQPRGFLSWRVECSDRWRAVTLLALVGLAVTVVMAFVGLPTVDLHTPLHHAGIMDPFCGGTRSIRLAAMGQWGASWMYNPLGIPLFLIFVALAVRTVLGYATGRWYTLTVNWTRQRIVAVVAVAVVLLVVLEVRQQSIAELLMAR